MKKLSLIQKAACLMFLLCIVGATAMADYPSGQPVKVIVDGRDLALAQPAVLYEGRVLVPLRGVFEALGAHVDYDPATQKITAMRGDNRVVLFVNSEQAVVDGKAQQLDVPPTIMNGSVMVPLRFVSEALMAEVHWSAYDLSVNIASRTGGVDVPVAPIGEVHPMTHLNILTPAPGSLVGRFFDIGGLTRPMANVHIRVEANRRLLGNGYAVHRVEILRTDTLANDSGHFHVRMDTGLLPSGSQIYVAIRTTNDQGTVIDQRELQLTRR